MDSLQTHILNELNFNFSVLVVMETRINDRMLTLIQPYHFEYVPMPLSAGGVERMKTTMYDTKSLKKPLMSLFRHWLEIEFTKKSNIICGVVYRQHNSADCLLEYFEETLDQYSTTSKSIYLFGDININILSQRLVITLSNF